MDEQTKRTMLKVRVSDDFLIFRTVSRARKSWIHTEIKCTF